MREEPLPPVPRVRAARPRRRFRWPVPLALAALLVAPACGHRDRSLARVFRTGVLRAGYAPERPYAFRDGAGRVVGHDPELLESVARAMGIGRVEWVQAEFGSLLDELATGRYDVVGMSLAVTPARAAHAAFSSPTAVATNALLVRAGNPLRISGYGDVARLPEARIVVIAGAIEEGFAEHAGVPRPRIVEVPDASTGAAAVRTGFAAAFGLTAPTLRSLAGAEGERELQVVVPVSDPVGGGVPQRTAGAFVFRPEDRALRTAFNEVLEVRLREPEYRSMARRYGFCVDPPMTPAGTAAAGRGR